ncbi:A/G-specific adenine glycosylase [Nitratiruptor sp. YY09-18]|uniref:A/G-specific adenine glycosylase n=1 Tax=Nitratiruptor sp. YY09-18 TaxID=2724901 RepID=UPI001915C827|nr:A/G-specific adenine glycosylase [Nitratiruptor sp. YY09-18]BCD68446.1 A/G-specific adenine glycosylase [Nitratiruptor sp. YY09-18]
MNKLTLLEWFKQYGRHELPWRKTSDPYEIYVSEIMLQQTQVERVLQKYEPFLQKFPALQSLRMASDEELLAQWSGLGYYRRALAMKKVANLVATLPQSIQELQKLPGIGKYTAHAIASFAYNQPVAVVDVNIERVLRRFFALTGSQKEVWQKASEFLNKASPKEHNLALMDLGSLVCATNPLCEVCPLQKECEGKNDPLKFWSKGKREYEKLDLHYALCVRNKRIALTPSKGSMYKGMLLLPVAKRKELLLGSFKHNYTKFAITVYCYKEEAEGELVWMDLEEAKTAHLPTLVKKALKFCGDLSMFS